MSHRASSAPTEEADNGKPVESRGRKATRLPLASDRESRQSSRRTSFVGGRSDADARPGSNAVSYVAGAGARPDCWMLGLVRDYGCAERRRQRAIWRKGTNSEQRVYRDRHD